MKRLFTLLLLSAGLAACTSVEYVDKEKLVNLFPGNDEADTNSLSPSSSIPGSEIKFAGSQSHSIKSLGSVVIGRFDSDGNKAKDPMVLKIKRSASTIYAETTLFDSDNKDKSFFDQGFLDIGVDKKNQGVNLALTFKY